MTENNTASNIEERLSNMETMLKNVLDIVSKNNRDWIQEAIFYIKEHEIVLSNDLAKHTSFYTSGQQREKLHSLLEREKIFRLPLQARGQPHVFIYDGHELTHILINLWKTQYLKRNSFTFEILDADKRRQVMNFILSSPLSKYFEKTDDYHIAQKGRIHKLAS